MANLASVVRKQPSLHRSDGDLEGVLMPEGEGIGSSLGVGGCRKSVAAVAENDVDLVVMRQKPLGLSLGLEALHPFLALRVGRRDPSI